MKSILVVLSFLAYFQAGLADQTAIAQQIGAALQGCVAELKLDKDVIVAQIKENIVPEDDEDLISLFGCFSEALETQNDDGEPDFEKLSPIVQTMLKQRLATVDDSNIQKITAAAIEHCKDTPKQERAGLTAIKIRNCIRAFVQSPELH